MFLSFRTPMTSSVASLSDLQGLSRVERTIRGACNRPSRAECESDDLKTICYWEADTLIQRIRNSVSTTSGSSKSRCRTKLTVGDFITVAKNSLNGWIKAPPRTTNKITQNVFEFLFRQLGVASYRNWNDMKSASTRTKICDEAMKKLRDVQAHPQYQTTWSQLPLDHLRANGRQDSDLLPGLAEAAVADKKQTSRSPSGVNPSNVIRGILMMVLILMPDVSATAATATSRNAATGSSVVTPLSTGPVSTSSTSSASLPLSSAYSPGSTMTTTNDDALPQPNFPPVDTAALQARTDAGTALARPSLAEYIRTGVNALAYVWNEAVQKADPAYLAKLITGGGGGGESKSSSATKSQQQEPKAKHESTALVPDAKYMVVGVWSGPDDAEKARSYAEKELNRYLPGVRVVDGKRWLLEPWKYGPMSAVLSMDAPAHEYAQQVKQAQIQPVKELMLLQSANLRVDPLNWKQSRTVEEWSPSMIHQAELHADVIEVVYPFQDNRASASQLEQKQRKDYWQTTNAWSSIAGYLAQVVEPPVFQSMDCQTCFASFDDPALTSASASSSGKGKASRSPATPFPGQMVIGWSFRDDALKEQGLSKSDAQRLFASLQKRMSGLAPWTRFVDVADWAEFPEAYGPLRAVVQLDHQGAFVNQRVDQLFQSSPTVKRVQGTVKPLRVAVHSIRMDVSDLDLTQQVEFSKNSDGKSVPNLAGVETLAQTLTAKLQPLLTSSSVTTDGSDIKVKTKEKSAVPTTYAQLEDPLIVIKVLNSESDKTADEWMKQVLQPMGRILKARYPHALVITEQEWKTVYSNDKRWTVAAVVALDDKIGRYGKWKPSYKDEYVSLVDSVACHQSGVQPLGVLLPVRPYEPSLDDKLNFKSLLVQEAKDLEKEGKMPDLAEYYYVGADESNRAGMVERMAKQIGDLLPMKKVRPAAQTVGCQITSLFWGS